MRSEQSSQRYYWTREEERELREYWKQGVRDPSIIAERLGRTTEGVKKKLNRMRFVVGTEKTVGPTTTDLDIPDELPTVEEALKLLAAAMNSLQQPGLSRTEISRLRTIVTVVKTYQELFADYADYRGIEARLIELEAKYAQIVARGRDMASGETSRESSNQDGATLE